MINDLGIEIYMHVRFFSTLNRKYEEEITIEQAYTLLAEAYNVDDNIRLISL